MLKAHCYMYGTHVGWITVGARTRWGRAAYWCAYDITGKWLGSSYTREGAQNRVFAEAKALAAIQREMRLPF